MRFNTATRIACAAGAVALVMCTACHGVVFWLSSDADNGCYDCLDSEDMNKVNETVHIAPGDPVVLTMWATLEGLSPNSNLTVISLDVSQDVSDGGNQSLEANAVWMFNPSLDEADYYRYQTTFMSRPEDFISDNLSLADDAAFPFCSSETACSFWSPNGGSFGAASIDGFEPDDGQGIRHGVGIGAAAKAMGDPGVVGAMPDHPDLWKVGLAEFNVLAEGTTQFMLTPGTALQGTSIEFSSIKLSLTVEFSADYDRDGDVDARDFLVWQRGGSPNPLSPQDLDAWQEQYGTEALSAAAAAVPEPNTRLILLVAIGLLKLTIVPGGREYVRSHANDWLSKVVGS